MRLKEKILRVFGDIKLQCWPPFLYYQPGDYYRVSGRDTRTALDMLRPGDLLLRGYNNYLDGKFIPGDFSHTGVYAGDGIIIHAIAEGVQEITVIDFMRCDRCAIVRPARGRKLAIERIESWLGRPYDFDFTSGNEAYYCHELAAEAYIELGVHKKTPYLGWLRFRKMEPKFLAESFLDNPNFRTIAKFGK